MTLMKNVYEKFKGIFDSEEAKQDTMTPNTPEQQAMYDMVMADFNVFKEDRRPIEDHWREEQRFYRGDHWYGLRSESTSRLRPNAVENVFWSQIEAITGKLCGWMPFPDFEGVEVKDEAKQRDLNDYVPKELRQIKFKAKHIRAVRRMVLHGPLIYETVFDPTVEGGRGLSRYQGRNDIIPVDLGSFYPDSRITDFLYLQDGAAHIIKAPKGLEYFRRRWPGQGDKVEPDYGGDDDVFATDGLNTDGFSRDMGVEYPKSSERRQTAGLIEYWYRGLPKVITPEDNDLFTEQAADKLARGVDPSEDLAKAEGQMEGIHCIYVSTSGVFLEHKAYVYDHGLYPFQVRVLFPDDANKWGKGFGRDMVKPQIFKNKYAEIAIETMARQGSSGIMYEEGAITKPQTWQERRGQPGAMLPVAQGRMNDVKEIQGINVPGTVFNSLNYYDEMLQKIPGQFDSANGQANANVTSGEQAKALMSAAGTRLNTASDTIQETLEEVFFQYIELMAQFYTDERIARVTGRQVTMSRASIIASVPTMFKTGNEVLDPETGQMVPEQLQVQEEYVPEFDITVHIGTEKPQEREYWMQLAFNLLKVVDPITGLPMVDAEAVRYVIQNGRMEPMDVIKDRIEQAAQREQQMQQQIAAGQQAIQQNQALQEQIAQFQGQQSQQAQEQQQFDRGIQQQRVNLEAAKVASGLMQNRQPGQG